MRNQVRPTTSHQPRATSHSTTRRRFLAGAAGAVVAPWLVPGTALGLDGAVPASDRITLGSIGVGVRGMEAIGAMFPLADAQIVAVCDARKPRLDAAQQRVAEHYGARLGKDTYRGCAAYHDFRELLSRDDIDAVVLCVPDHWHGIVTTRAAQAGKDIYGEKPITRTIAEGFTVRDAVRRYGRIFQTGTQQRSDPQFRHACQLARNGYLGKVHTIRVAVPGGVPYPVAAPEDPPPGFDYDLWTGPAPLVPFDAKRCEWLAMYMISHYCAGFVCNWGVHHLDIAQWGCPEVTTAPFELSGSSVFPEEGMTDTCIAWQVEFKYASGLRMHFTNNGNPYPQGCRFEGDQGWVYVDRGRIDAEPKSLLRAVFKPNDVRLHVSPAHANPYVAHSADFLWSVRTRREPVSPLDQGHLASTLGNVADIMLRLGRPMKWDPAAERFINDNDANAMLSRPMRSPWVL